MFFSQTSLVTSAWFYKGLILQTLGLLGSHNFEVSSFNIDKAVWPCTERLHPGMIPKYTKTISLVLLVFH